MFGVRMLLNAAVGIIMLGLVPAVRAENKSIGVARNAVGVLIVVRADGVQERLQGKGTLPLYEGDVAKTDAAGRALLEMMGAQVGLNEQTTVKFLARWEKHKPPTGILRITRGELWLKMAAGSAPLEIETPVANVLAREGEFDMKVQDDGQSTLAVTQGGAQVSTPFGACFVLAPSASVNTRGKVCKKLASSDSTPLLAWLQPLRKELQ